MKHTCNVELSDNLINVLATIDRTISHRTHASEIPY